MEPVCPVDKYDAVDDLCVLTTYFNPCCYSTILDNYNNFRASMERSGITLYTVECAFQGTPFQLPSHERVIQVRSNSVLWQKERMLNIAIERVKDGFAKIAWIDADLFFTTADWAVRASRLLDDYPIIQLFKRAIALPQGAKYYTGDGINSRGIVSMCTRKPELLLEGYDHHGHTGYAWAATRETLSIGLFDKFVLSSGDHLMAHAALGDWSSGCLERIFFADQDNRRCFKTWAEAHYDLTKGRWGYLPEIVLHRWHGNPVNRGACKRNERLSRFGIDPDIDLSKNEDGCWEWASDRPLLHKYVAEYFESRRDDFQV